MLYSWRVSQPSTRRVQYPMDLAQGRRAVQSGSRHVRWWQRPPGTAGPCRGRHAQRRSAGRARPGPGRRADGVPAARHRPCDRHGGRQSGTGLGRRRRPAHLGRRAWQPWCSVGGHGVRRAGCHCRIGEDEITAGGRCQRALRPGTPPLLVGCPRGHREISEVEQVIEEACPGVEHSGVSQCGRASLPGVNDVSEPLVEVRVKLPRMRRGPMARVEISDMLAIAVVRLISGPVPDDPQPRGHR